MCNSKKENQVGSESDRKNKPKYQMVKSTVDYRDIPEGPTEDRSEQNLKDYKECKKAFDLFDKNNNGSLSLEEITGLCKQMGFNITLPEVKKFFKQVDSNNDGQISFEEFYVWYKNGGKVSNDKVYQTQVKVLKNIHKWTDYSDLKPLTNESIYKFLKFKVYNMDFKPGLRLGMVFSPKSMDDTGIVQVISNMPKYNPKYYYGYLTLDSDKPLKLKKELNFCLDRMFEVATEMFGEKLSDLVSRHHIFTLTSNKKVYLILKLNEMKVLREVLDSVDEAASNTIGDDANSSFNAFIQTKLNIYEMMTKPEFAKETFENLLASVNIETTKGSLRRIRKIYMNSGNWGRTPRIEKYINMLLYSMNIELKLKNVAKELDMETMDELSKQIRKELMNIIKDYFETFIELTEQYPFLTETIDCLLKYGKPPFTAGFIQNFKFEVSAEVPEFAKAYQHFAGEI